MIGVDHNHFAPPEPIEPITGSAAVGYCWVIGQRTNPDKAAVRLLMLLSLHVPLVPLCDLYRLLFIGQQFDRYGLLECIHRLYGYTRARQIGDSISNVALPKPPPKEEEDLFL